MSRLLVKQAAVADLVMNEVGREKRVFFNYTVAAPCGQSRALAVRGPGAAAVGQTSIACLFQRFGRVFRDFDCLRQRCSVP